MIKKLFFLSLIIYVLPSYAMKRSRNTLQKQLQHNKLHNKNCTAEIYESIKAPCKLIEDVQNIIIDFSTNNTLAKKPKKAAYTVNALAQTNKRINALINDPTFSDNLINKFSQKFYCSHETIARLLGTQQAKKRLKLQRKLKLLCFTPYCHICPRYQAAVITSKLNSLTAKKINLEFTYNHGSLQKTPLMISMGYNPSTFEILLRSGANVNGCNAHSLTPLKLAIDFPINHRIYRKILDNPQLIIDQQNKHGESALLRCLIRRKYPRQHWPIITENFITMIRDILDAGADPELVNHAGIAPFDAAKLLNNEEIMRVIQHAIDQKRAPAQ